MTRTRTLFLTTLACSLVTACASSTKKDAATTDPTDSAAGDVGGGDGPAPAVVPDGIAVLGSDFMTTSVSLVDARTGKVKKAECVNSGTMAPQLTQTLSGDVVLPSQMQAGHRLVVIDRGNAAVAWLDPAGCTPVRQVSVKTGFKSNPRDVVSLSDTKAYVTRYDHNPVPTADPADFDEGDDLLIVDPSTGAIKGRVDLSTYATSTAVQVRVNRAVLAAGKVFVTLDNLSADYMTAAEGRVVIVDPATDAVVGQVDLKGLKGCQSIQVDEATSTVLVVCAGNFNDGDMQVAGSALVAIDAAATPPAIKKTYPAASRPLSGAALAVTGGAAYVVASGDFTAMTNDELWVVDLVTGAGTKVAEASGAFTFGAVALDASAARLLLADGDAKTPVIRLFDIITPGTPVALTSIAAPGGLPPREITAY